MLGGKVAPARVACTSMRLPLAPGCGAEQSSHGNSPAAPDIRQSVQRTRGCPARRGCREKCCPARVRRLRSGHLGVSRPSAARPLCSSRWRVVGECFGDVALAPIGCARCLGARSVSPSMNEGSLSSPPLCFGGTGRLREGGRPPAWMLAEPRPDGGCRRSLRAAGGVAGWSGAHLSIASSNSKTRCDRCSLRRRNSKMDCQAVRAKMAPAGAKGLNGWLRVSMYQIASVSLRASSICATLAPR